MFSLFLNFNLLCWNKCGKCKYSGGKQALLSVFLTDDGERGFIRLLLFQNWTWARDVAVYALGFSLGSILPPGKYVTHCSRWGCWEDGSHIAASFHLPPTMETLQPHFDSGHFLSKMAPPAVEIKTWCVEWKDGAARFHSLTLDDIVISTLAVNKDPLHRPCFPAPLHSSLDFHLYCGCCLRLISRHARMWQPAWPSPLSKNNMKNTKAGWQQRQTWTAEMQRADNEGTKARMVGILLPAVDLVGSLSWHSWAVWRSPREGGYKRTTVLWESVLLL